MNRREFAKFVGVGAAMLAVPGIVLGKTIKRALAKKPKRGSLTLVWTGKVSGDFDDPRNWHMNHKPQKGDELIFSPPIPLTVPPGKTFDTVWAHPDMFVVKY